jgi:hypothetical protein
MKLRKMERYLPVNLLGPGGPLVLYKKNLPGRGLAKVEKHWHRCLCLLNGASVISTVHIGVGDLGNQIAFLYEKCNVRYIKAYEKNNQTLRMEINSSYCKCVICVPLLLDVCPRSAAFLRLHKVFINVNSVPLCTNAHLQYPTTYVVLSMQ